MILVDTSGVLAMHELTNPYRERALQVLTQPQVRILSPFILAELDYLITKYAGARAAMTFLRDVEQGVYALETFSASDIARARAVMKRYPGLGLGLADASIIVLAERHDCYDVLTLDQRHFRSIVGNHGTPFRLFPLDTGP